MPSAHLHSLLPINSINRNNQRYYKHIPLSWSKSRKPCRMNYEQLVKKDNLKSIYYAQNAKITLAGFHKHHVEVFSYGGDAMNYDLLADNRIQEILDKRGMVQKDLADMIGLYQSDISDIIAGKVKRLTLVRAAMISVALGYSMEYIWPSLFK